MADREADADWWATEIIDMAPGEIRYRGYAIEDLIGRVGFAEMAWLLLRGELPSRAEAALLEVALVAAVDHGPQAPSIAIARMAATCGVGLNNAMASAVNVLGDVHGGAGEQAVALYDQIVREGGDLAAATTMALDAFFASGQRFLPGFGHRFHPIDPRAPRLMEVADAAAGRGEIGGRHRAAALEIERQLAERKGRPIPMNIDGATAVIYAELGFPAPLARGLFCLSRSVGVLAHAWEEIQAGQRNKGPIPRDTIWSYTGPAPRRLPDPLP
ncbi:MAG: citryl-CoA lyase [Pseudomonadota bacterium]